MKSIVVTYPGFQTLPKGLKMMLVASESFFFHEANACLPKPGSEEWTARTTLKPQRGFDLGERFLASGTAWRN
jgi:hypothetical protein